MSRFFNFFAVLCAGLLVLTTFSGYFPAALGFSSGQHMLLGLTSGILVVSLHCLIFAIFTGAGKDTRLLVEDLRLSGDFVKKAKAFKHQVFPPALYAILVVILTTSMGGVLGARGGGQILGWVHAGLAWFNLYYNLKVFWMEAQAVRKNAELIDEVNAVAAKVPAPVGATDEINPDATETFEWGTHVYALGKFLTFMAYNTWLPYIYFRYIMAIFTTPFWPFLAVSLTFFVGGYYLRWAYGSFRPRKINSNPSDLPSSTDSRYTSPPRLPA